MLLPPKILAAEASDLVIQEKCLINFENLVRIKELWITHNFHDSEAKSEDLEILNQVKVIEAELDNLMLPGARSFCSSDYQGVAGHAEKLFRIISKRLNTNLSNSFLKKVRHSLLQKGSKIGITSAEGDETWARADDALHEFFEIIKDADVQKVGFVIRDGVRKTVISEVLRNSPALKRQFERVIWVSVPPSKNSSAKEVQMQVAQQLSLTVQDSDEQHVIARQLIRMLYKRKYLLILDGISHHMELIQLGIIGPSLQGRKIVMLSSCSEVCYRMGVNVIIDVECPSEDMFFELFTKNVGDAALNPDIEPIAKHIVAACGDYPLSIILMARALRETKDIAVWMDALYRLVSIPSPVEDANYFLSTLIQFCLERLEANSMRECLNYFVLHIKNEKVSTVSLIESWIMKGLVDQVSGWQILNDLLSAFLLEKVEGYQFVRIHPLVRKILESVILPREESKSFLMKGGLRINEPPAAKEWTEAKEIYLMDNELSTLPECPNCPGLSKLFLQRNKKLRIIPSAFFLYMPALRVLNLSRTRIRVLPKSLFNLGILQQLFLNYCERLMELPDEVKQLGNLEVLDLEGTEIKNLPEGVRSLTKLKCLEVSFCQVRKDGSRTSQSDRIIPCGVIANLALLEELSINVNPEDARWSSSVETILQEICCLTRLSALKLYFPCFNLFNRHWMAGALAAFRTAKSFFRFTVGFHVNCVFSRLPADVKSEFERADRCFRLVNSEFILQDFFSLVQHLDVFYLDCHLTARSLSQFFVVHEWLLKSCIISGCSELQTIIDGHEAYEGMLSSLECLSVYHVKKLRSVWDGPSERNVLTYLTSLTLCSCPKLTILFRLEILQNLYHLEEMIIKDCPLITSLVAIDDQKNRFSNLSRLLLKLRKLHLRFLPELVSTFHGMDIAKYLKQISIYNCPKLVHLFGSISATKCLRKIKGERDWWNRLPNRNLYNLDGIFVPVE
ncbi:Leucine-rich repeat [Dillenia turbinata]|uniref:Leucine-rich repeat n=1 Tax=Dillenia turbinata TaxID=194707 RepID=A0AAN8ZQ44_9MAGN